VCSTNHNRRHYMNYIGLAGFRKDIELASSYCSTGVQRELNKQCHPGTFESNRTQFSYLERRIPRRRTDSPSWSTCVSPFCCILSNDMDPSRGFDDCCSFSISQSFRDILVESGGVTTTKVLAALALALPSWVRSKVPRTQIGETLLTHRRRQPFL
jgi:hypothetical protein